MTSKKLKNPYDLVAEVLKVPKESLTENSAWKEHPHWDSLNHLGIIIAMEKDYKILIPDHEIEKYKSIKEIVALYESLND